MKRYLMPPSPDIVFDPPCPLYASNARQNILEIGSGTGYLSLSLAPLLSPNSTLTLTDLHEVLPLLATNLAQARGRWMSSIHPSYLPTIKVEGLPWGDEEALRNLSLNIEDPEFIIAADLVYFPFLYPPLLRTLIGLTTPRSPESSSPTVLFAGKVRSLAREEPFWSAFGEPELSTGWPVINTQTS